MSNKKEWKKGWKVINKDRLSCTAPYRKHPVKYLKNKETSRPTAEKGRAYGPLAVFKTREDARMFKKRVLNITSENKQWKIVKCKYVESKIPFLFEYFYHWNRRSSWDLPEGTAFADKVKCLE